MIILGIVLLAAAVVAAVELILANDAHISFHMWRWTWHIDAFWLAVGGAAILVVGLLGLSMLKAGSGRARRLRRERRELARENRRLVQRAEVAEASPAAAAGSDGFGPSGERPVAAAETYRAPTGSAVPPAGQYPAPPEDQYAAGQHQASEPVERRP